MITGWGKCRPPVSLTNADLERLVDTSDEWIVTRTGIRERGIAHVECTDLAELAARRALAAAGHDPDAAGDALDLICVATTTPESLCPSTAVEIQRRLGATGTAAFDTNAACSGFVYALATVASLVETGVARRALVVGAERLSYLMDYHERSTCVLFGDGAGAVVLEGVDTPDDAPRPGVLGVDLGADGSRSHLIAFGGIGTRGTIDRHDPADFSVQFAGQAVFKIAVEGMAASARRALERAGLGPDDVDVFVPHQANRRIIDAAARRLGLDPERVVVDIETHGNTAAASVPMALTDALAAGRIAPGDVVVTS
ncbi:MAG: ketoacyl-ACP synthase III, partial [Actinomyces sp.]